VVRFIRSHLDLVTSKADQVVLPRSFAKTITKEKRDQDFARLEVYERWFNESILSGQHSNSLVIMPLESMVPRYRDEAPT
jgi:hypothetical protein